MRYVSAADQKADSLCIESGVRIRLGDVNFGPLEANVALVGNTEVFSAEVPGVPLG